MIKMKTLDEMANGKKVKIIGFSRRGRGVVRRIENIMNPDNVIEIISNYPFRGPLLLKINNYEFAIGRGMARKIYVKEYKNKNSEK
jgi:ferrous iron transport protein A